MYNGCLSLEILRQTNTRDIVDQSLASGVSSHVRGDLCYDAMITSVMYSQLRCAWFRTQNRNNVMSGHCRKHRWELILTGISVVRMISVSRGFACPSISKGEQLSQNSTVISKHHLLPRMSVYVSVDICHFLTSYLCPPDCRSAEKTTDRHTKHADGYIYAQTQAHAGTYSSRER